MAKFGSSLTKGSSWFIYSAPFLLCKKQLSCNWEYREVAQPISSCVFFYSSLCKIVQRRIENLDYYSVCTYPYFFEHPVFGSYFNTQVAWKSTLKQKLAYKPDRYVYGFGVSFSSHFWQNYCKLEKATLLKKIVKNTWFWWSSVSKMKKSHFKMLAYILNFGAK